VANAPENELRPETFIELLKSDLKQGRGFIPLLGSGVSFPSGIPTIRQLSRYLERCIDMALNVEHPVRPWDPRQDTWPPLRDVDLLSSNPLGRISGQMMTAFQEGKLKQVLLYQHAIGALPDWRSSLRFLAKMNSTTVDVLESSVIDSFFLHVTNGKYPALAHRMLALLSDLLRFRIILTTNFDDLYERAAADANRPVTVYDVHVHAGLPSRRLLELERALIKLHGGRYGLRS
jgi:hypothetical protein